MNFQEQLNTEKKAQEILRNDAMVKQSLNEVRSKIQHPNSWIREKRLLKS